MTDLKKLKRLVGVLALVSFSVQMVHALQHYFANPATTFVTRSSLSQLDKHIMVVICRTRQFNREIGKGLGYSSVTSYLTGKTDNASVLSWSGQDGDVNPEDVLHKIFSLGIENITLKKEINIAKRFFLPFGMCSVVSAPPKVFLTSNGMYKISLYLNGTGDYMVSVLDPEAAPRYQLPFHQMAGITPSIYLRPDQIIRKYYSIQLTYHRNQASDGSCMNYPDQHGHESFADCIEAENRKKTLPVLGCMLPWMSKLNHCSGFQAITPGSQALMELLSSAYEHAKLGLLKKDSSCPPPCDMLIARGRYLYTYKDKYQSTVKLTLVEEIAVKTIMSAYGFDNLLVEVGSSLGLWLGLSVFGLYDVLVAIVSKIRILMSK